MTLLASNRIASFFMLVTVGASRDKLAQIASIQPSSGTSLSGKTASNATGREKNINYTSFNVDGKYPFSLSRIAKIKIDLFRDDEDAGVLFDWKDSSGTGTIQGNDYHWYGESINGNDSITIIKPFVGDGDKQTSVLFGSATVGGNVHSIMVSTDGSVFVSSMSSIDFPFEKDEDSKAKGLSLSSLSKFQERELSVLGSVTKSSNVRHLDDGSVIDVMCVYTSQTVCQEAIVANLIQSNSCNVTQYKYLMDAKCQLAVAQSNTAYASSGVKSKLNLVYSDYLDPNYTEDPNWDNNINTILDQTNPMFQSMFSKRESYAADLIAVILNNGQYCGSGGGLDYFFVNQSCMVGYYSFAHEIGHIMGCWHESAIYNNPSGSKFGYTDTVNGFRTIMAVNPSLTRIQYFSNPDSRYMYNGKPIGTSSANCVATMNSKINIVANNRQSSTRTIDASTQMPSRHPTNRKPTSRPKLRPSRRPTNRKPTSRPKLNPTLNPSELLPNCIQSALCNSNQMALILRLDRPQVLKWNITDQVTHQLFCSGGPYSSSTLSPQNFCLKTGKSMKLQMSDIGNVGFSNSSSTYNITIRPYGSSINSYYFTKKFAQNQTSSLRAHYFST